MDRLTAEAALSHPFLLQYSCPEDEPTSPHPFRIEDELEDSLITEQSLSNSNSQVSSMHWERCGHLWMFSSNIKGNIFTIYLGKLKLYSLDHYGNLVWFIFKMVFSIVTISSMSCSAGTGTVFPQTCPGSSRAAVVTASLPVMVPLTWEMLLRMRRCRETPEPAPPCC